MKEPTFIQYRPFSLLLTYSVPRDCGSVERFQSLMKGAARLRALLQAEAEEASGVSGAPRDCSFLREVVSVESRFSGDAYLTVIQVLVPERYDQETIAFHYFFTELTNQLGDLGLPYDALRSLP
jgi:hypothetical protein